MSRPFPRTMPFTGNYAPILMECDAYDLPVEGELPAGLHGTLLRNGANPQFAPRDPGYHWFLGDGMVHAFNIADGRVTYRNRWVRTPKWELEHAAGEALFGSWGNPRTTDPRALGKDGGVANTSLVWHGGRLFALEEGHQPFELAPDTLKSLGYHDFAGKITGNFTAHPRIDPETGEMLFFAYSADGMLTPGIVYGVISPSGEVTRKELFQAPFCAMVHDFAVTRNHVLFPVLPLTGSLDRAMSGGPVFAWEPDKGAWIGIMRRDAGPGSLRWFRGDPCFVFHLMNAWEEGEQICAEVVRYDRPPYFPDTQGTPGPAGVGRLARWRFDLSQPGDGFAWDFIDDMQSEFPRIDERFTGLPYRHGWLACERPEGRTDAAGGLEHIDVKSGERTVFWMPQGDSVSEPVFVPRTADAAEGDGWLLAVAWRGAERRSDLIVLDADALADGPVATVALSHRVPFGFHGTWRPG